ncbi:unnamed protein product [Adineta steineri]|uniref:Uncharacterized protein n=1 Tax=Adineta steineri TaxID=433720 RepID=A0A819M025_9BILA|nr:unnamed protein product [Adineta steineri]CAF3998517.1 unnamed protein product [Adineta steineri]
MLFPLVSSPSLSTNDEVAQLAKSFNETLDFCPNNVLTMQHRPAIAIAFIQLNKTVMDNLEGVGSVIV